MFFGVISVFFRRGLRGHQIEVGNRANCRCRQALNLKIDSSLNATWQGLMDERRAKYITGAPG